jgi:hypothetical protein
MGWSHAGNTRQKYQHYYNDDSFDAMLTMMDGLKPISPARNRTLLKPRLCPNCSEINTPESKFCSKCKFVLTFDAFNEATKESEKTKQQMEEMEKRLNIMYEALQAMQKVKDADEARMKLITENDKMRQIAKEILLEEHQELEGDLQEEGEEEKK